MVTSLFPRSVAVISKDELFLGGGLMKCEENQVVIESKCGKNQALDKIDIDRSVADVAGQTNAFPSLVF